MAKKSTSTPGNGNYVFGHPLFADRAVIPPQKLYSDTAYWYDKAKREKLWKSNIPKADKNFYAPFKGSPYGFTESLPEWYSDHIGEVQIQEFEFSRNTLVRTLFSQDIDGLGDDPNNPMIGHLRFVTRDVVTGSFFQKNGSITGTAYSLARQTIGDGRPVGKNIVRGPGMQIVSEEFTYSSEDIFYWEAEQGLPVISGAGETGLGITWPYDGGWKTIEPIQASPDSGNVGSISIQKFFPNGWELNPFGNNLI
jgi:hypothetical protein